MLRNVTIGSDPEMFLFDNSTKTVVSSIGLIPGVKGNAWVDPSWKPGFGLETDNILVEFNIPPCTNKIDFVENIFFMKNYIRQFVKQFNNNYDVRCEASFMVPENQLQSDEAKLLGCSVDYNVYTEEPNPKPEGNKTNLRSGGFHIHVGYNNPNVQTSLNMIKYLDAFLGVPSVIYDTDTRRRALYGKAGCFRLTAYGFEYRVISSHFLKTKTLVRFVWDQTAKAIAAFNSEKILPEPAQVIDAINNSNIELAKKLIDVYNLR